MNKSILLTILFAIVIFQIANEKIPINDGAIGDAAFYREVAASFLDTLDSEQGYNFLQIQRILPFAIINGVYVILGFEMDNNALMSGMLILNLLMLTLATFWYFSLTKKLRLTKNMEALGFILIFFNFPVLKDFWYNPFTTDMTALAFGIGQINYFVRYEKSKLLLLSLLGAFVWPTTFLIGIILLILPNKALEIYQGERVKSFFPIISTAFIIAIATALSFYLGRTDASFSQTEIIFHKISLICLTPFLMYLMINNPINWEKSIPIMFKSINGSRILGFSATFFGMLFILFLISTNNANLSSYTWAKGFWDQNLRFPLDFLGAHTVYFGVLFPAIIAFLPRVIKAMAKLGTGFTFALLIIAGLTIHPESRLITPFIPFFVLLLLKALRRYSLSTMDLYFAFGLNLILSTFYLQINSADFISKLGNAEALPMMYYGHFGNHFNIIAYLIAIALFAGLTFLSFQAKNKYTREKDV
ncbi:hypothetical protein [Belliella aquatica]|uniref:Uncharacterized protein n=1 Tax=Belliella aquatica TaxID=1323734 RepID=A0ABQ1LYS1_9BACT|nr:hypothetical protein [Belliella aquatica]MCH7407328.1 hypothetical protein [Belliella aquatica]GGC31771.1 hypothetical protein GCM10010993_08420 [Belliella aquatica]